TPTPGALHTLDGYLREVIASSKIYPPAPRANWPWPGAPGAHDPRGAIALIRADAGRAGGSGPVSRRPGRSGRRAGRPVRPTPPRRRVTPATVGRTRRPLP